MHAAAAQQLAALRDEQRTSRAAVSAHITALARAKAALETAQREEAELTAQLQAAARRTAQLHGEHDKAEARLRDAAEHLADTQSMCHHLESEVAAYVKCQRAAVVLSAPVAAFLRESSLCWLDSYSALHKPSGQVFSCDGIIPLAKEDDISESGEEGQEEEEEEAGVCSSTYVDVKLTSLLKGVAHDALQGFHYTLLHTTTCDDETAERKEGGDFNEKGRSSSSAPSKSTLSVHQLSCLLLRLLQDDAAQCGTRALAVSLAVGRVVASSSFGADCAAAEARPLLEDVLGPVVAHHRASSSSSRGDITMVQMAATVAAAADTADGSTTQPRLGPKDVNTPPAKGAQRTSHCAARHSSSSSSASPPLRLPLLTGVQVCSLDEAKFWLAQAGLRSTDDSGSGALERVHAGNGFSVGRSHHDAAESTSPFVVLLGVDSEDAGGTVHKALLRILSDIMFCPSASAAFGLTTATTSSTLSGNAVPLSPFSPSSPHHLSPSLFYDFMHAAVMATVRAVVDDAAWNATDSPVLPSDAIERAAQRLIEHPYMGLSAAATRSAVQAVMSSCPIGVAGKAAQQQQRRLSEEWLLWAALLRQVFGGNSKALWLHTVSTAASTYVHEEDRTQRQSCASSSPSSTEGVLTLCALFCRLVRHDAVPWAMPADLYRLLRMPR